MAKETDALINQVSEAQKITKAVREFCKNRGCDDRKRMMCGRFGACEALQESKLLPNPQKANTIIILTYGERNKDSNPPSAD